jgi:hypothetical protein
MTMSLLRDWGCGMEKALGSIPITTFQKKKKKEKKRKEI